MIPLLLILLYKKKGKNISRAAKRVLNKAKAKRAHRKTETKRTLKQAGTRIKPIRNVYSKFRNNRLNRKRARNR